MSDLVAWLTKILDEDERWAASGANFHNWSPRNPWQLDDAVSVRDIAVNGIRVGTISTDYDEHVTRHDPASVLADIAAKRAIIDEYVARDKDADLMLGPDCLRQREWSGLRLAVQLMATGYAARPGYRDEWKPLSTRTHP